MNRAEVVALRKESVDRNLWWGVRKAVGSLVALRKESVDRNFYYSDKDADWVRSLSARRAWIEINTRNQPGKPKAVALRKESVDRNPWDLMGDLSYDSRSPQGERG